MFLGLPYCLANSSSDRGAASRLTTRSVTCVTGQTGVLPVEEDTATCLVSPPPGMYLAAIS